MADAACEGSEIVLKLSAGERIMAMHRDVRVPLSAVKSVDVVDEPIRRIQGLKPRKFKVFGGYWPGLVRVWALLRRGRAPATVRRCPQPEASRTGDRPRRRQVHPP
jgi:hypothetical protein